MGTQYITDNHFLGANANDFPNPTQSLGQLQLQLFLLCIPVFDLWFKGVAGVDGGDRRRGAVGEGVMDDGDGVWALVLFEGCWDTGRGREYPELVWLLSS